MKPAMKWGVAALAGGAVFLAFRKLKKSQQQNADQTQLALQQLIQSSQPVITYGEWREITQNQKVDYWNLPRPDFVEGKKIDSVSVEYEGGADPTYYGATPYYNDKHCGIILVQDIPTLTGYFRLKALWL